MVIMLRDDQVIEVFDSADKPPSWIEGIDVANGEYEFCDDQGQRYVGVVTQSSTWRKQAEFVLRREGMPELKNALDLINRAQEIERNDRFPDLQSLREHLTGAQRTPMSVLLHAGRLLRGVAGAHRWG